jgi:3-dehydroquinate synthetase
MTTLQTLQVSLPEQPATSYPIYISQGGLSNKDLFLPHLAKADNKVVIVTNSVVAPLYLAKVQQLLEACGQTVLTLVLPDGEATKTWDTLNHILTQLLNWHCDRKTTLVALGGGVIGDMTGFAAAIYPNSYYAVITGRFVNWGQNSGQSSLGKKYDWCVLPAQSGDYRCRHFANLA